MQREPKNQQNTLIESAIYKQALSIRRERTGVAILALIFILILNKIFPFRVPAQISFSIFALVLSFTLFLYIARRARSLTILEHLYVIFSLFEIIILTFIIHYLGGVEWIGIIIYMFLVVEANIVLPPPKGLAVTLAAAASYIGLVFLEYWGVFPHREFFLIKPGLYKDIFYIMFTVLTGTLMVFFFISKTSGNFSGMFKKQAQVLERARGELEEAKKILEIRVQAKTFELRELAKNLEFQIKERTRELEKERRELATRIAELERFHKVAVGRELKMRELKKELERVKQKNGEK